MKYNRCTVNSTHNRVFALLLTFSLILGILCITGCSKNTSASESSSMMEMTIDSDSMEPEFSHSDVIAVNTDFDVNSLAVGDIIAFYGGDDNNSIYIHRITAVLDQDGEKCFQTKADANEAVDPDLVQAKSIIGVFDHIVSKGNN